MPKMIFLNLPVTDLAATERFYAAIGCTRNDQFSDENAVSMAWSEEIVFMLLKHEFFSTFISKPIADAHVAVGALICLSLDSREDVDSVTKAAGAAGGQTDTRPPMDHGWMYNRAFADPDGHVFEVVFMDPSAMPAA